MKRTRAESEGEGESEEEDKRTRAESEGEGEDHLSTLPYDLLDFICGLDPWDRIFTTVPSTDNVFEVAQRCGRLSMTARYYSEWIKQSIHRREVRDLLLIGLNACMNMGSFNMPSLCKIVQNNEPFKRVFGDVLNNPSNATLRDGTFARMKNGWKNAVHGSHTAGLSLNITALLAKIAVTAKPTTPEDIELLLAYYSVDVDFSKNRVLVTKPLPYNMLSELMIYDDDAAAAKEDDDEADYKISLFEQDARTSHGKIDVRFLEPLLVPNDDGFLIQWNKVYAVTKNYTTEPLKFAQASRASERLRTVLVQCYEAKYTEKQKNRRKRANLGLNYSDI